MHCPGKVTKSFELTEKMRKLIEKLVVYLYTFRKLIVLSRAGCALHKHDTVSYAEKEQETLKCIFDLFIFTQTDTQSFIQILPFGG